MIHFSFWFHFPGIFTEWSCIREGEISCYSKRISFSFIDFFSLLSWNVYYVVSSYLFCSGINFSGQSSWMLRWGLWILKLQTLLSSRKQDNGRWYLCLCRYFFFFKQYFRVVVDSIVKSTMKVQMSWPVELLFMFHWTSINPRGSYRTC